MFDNLNNITSTTTSCNNCDCTTTTTLPCINSIDELFLIADRYSKANNISYINALTSLLDDGFILNSCSLCCSFCPYIYTTKEMYDDYFPAAPELPPVGAVEKSSSADGVCCINAYGRDVITREQTSPFCCNNFTECAEEIFKYFSENLCETSNVFNIDNLNMLYSLIITTGIVEQGEINGTSQVCSIFENLKLYLNKPCFIEEFFTLLNTGIVIFCINGIMYMTSVITFDSIFQNQSP